LVRSLYAFPSRARVRGRVPHRPSPFGQLPVCHVIEIKTEKDRDGEERDVPMMRGIDAIITCCRHELWQYVSLPHIPAVQITVETRSAFLTCFCEARDADKQVVCYTRYSAKPPPGRRAAVAEFVHRANWNLAVGCFEFNPETGEVRFRTSLDLDLALD